MVIVRRLVCWPSSGCCAYIAALIIRPHHQVAHSLTHSLTHPPTHEPTTLSFVTPPLLQLFSHCLLYIYYPCLGESLTARCETCRRLLLYNEQEPGLAPGPGQGSGHGQGSGQGQGQGPHPEHESGPGLGHEPESELGSGSGSEVPDGGSEVGVVAVASLDLGEGAAATAIPTVAVLR